MCGIAGYLGSIPAENDEALLRKLLSGVVHRGPDGSDLWSEEGLGFAHARLAIIDLSDAGKQPMMSADARWVITFNGEIYNHADIRARLNSQRKIAWKGHSDTEVLLEAVATWGPRETLDLLNGMFAFALWDRKHRNLTLARDSFGEKPLYLCWGDKRLYFASDLAAFDVVNDWDDSLSERAVAQVLSRGYVASPLTIFNGAFKLPRGSTLTLTEKDVFSQLSERELEGRLEIFRAPDLRTCREGVRSRENSYDDEISEFRRILDAAVSRRLQADVGVGILLSGGIDSSLVAESASRMSGGGLESFTVAFGERSFDEGYRARRTAECLGMRHHEIRLSSDDALANVEKLALVYSEPFADASALPTTLLSKFSSGHVKVVLSGDGGDEFFCGYKRYTDAARLFPFWSAVPNWLRPSAGRMMHSVAMVTPPSGLSRLLSRQADRIFALDDSDYVASFSNFSLPLGGERIGGVVQRIKASAGGVFILDSMMNLDRNGWLPDGVLAKVDRASMAFGLEVRCPLLDREIVDFSNRLPVHYLIRGRVGKRILRDAIQSIPVLSGLADAEKKGFEVPLATWLRGSLKCWMMDLIESARRLDIPGLNHAELCSAAASHLRGQQDRSRTLWAALMLISWNLGRKGRLDEIARNF